MVVKLLIILMKDMEVIVVEMILIVMDMTVHSRPVVKE